MMNKPDDLTGLVDAIDDVSELVYVADPETHDLLYMNRAGKTALNIDSLEGLKCYKVIELQDAPCPLLRLRAFWSISMGEPSRQRRFGSLKIFTNGQNYPRKGQSYRFCIE